MLVVCFKEMSLTKSQVNVVRQIRDLLVNVFGLDIGVQGCCIHCRNIGAVANRHTDAVLMPFNQPLLSSSAFSSMVSTSPSLLIVFMFVAPLRQAARMIWNIRRGSERLSRERLTTSSARR